MKNTPTLILFCFLAIGIVGFNIKNNITLAHKKQYVFDTKLSYTFSDKKEKKSNFTFSYGKNGTILIELDDLKNRMINDIENEVIITLDDKAKTAIVMSTKFTNKLMTKQIENQNDDFTVTKTTESKKILGYQATKYIVTDKKNEKTIIWTSTELDYNNEDLHKAISKRLGISLNGFNNKIEGFLMETVQYNKKDEVIARMTLTNFAKETTTVNLNLYTVNEINFGN